MSAMEWLKPATTKNITGTHAPRMRPAASLADRLTSTATVTRMLHSTPMKKAFSKGMDILLCARCSV